MEKPWFKSKTIIGAILMFIALIFSFFGVTISPEEQAGMADLIVQVAEGIAGLVGFILAIYGRIKANTFIK
ncbi:MAG: hypothetical protein ABIL39_10700 [candidate division WOR-3 bacterium]